jgi:hypothetical protein
MTGDDSDSNHETEAAMNRRVKRWIAFTVATGTGLALAWLPTVAHAGITATGVD